MDGDKYIGCHRFFQGSPGWVTIRLKKKKKVIEPGLQKQIKIFCIAEFQTIGEQPADLAIFFCMSDQVCEILTQGGLTTCKCDVRNASLPGFVQDRAPLRSC